MLPCPRLPLSHTFSPVHFAAPFPQSVHDQTVSLSLDLTEVTLVDRDVVRFFAACELKSIELRNCPGFLREWAKDKLRMHVDS